MRPDAEPKQEKIMPEEKKAPACTGCREKKLRCVHSSESSESCDRCVRLGRECRAPQVKQRARKTRLRGRVDQLENSYSEILSLLRKNSHQPQPQHQPSVTGQCPGSGPATSTTDYARSPTSLASTAPTQTTAWPAPSHGLSSAPGGLLGIEDLSLETFQSFVGAYRRMSRDNFPFVIIPEGYNLAAMVQDRPILSRAIITVTSWTHPNPARQSALRAAFLREFTERYYLKSEKSLDLLQAVLVYYGWCHWFAAPFPSQAYRFSSLIITMAVELGITQRPVVTQHEMVVNSSSSAEQTSDTASPQNWSHDARRACVGAFALSSFCLLMYRKPNLLPHSPYLDECVASLAADPRCPSDVLLVHRVKFLRMAESVSECFDHGTREKVGDLSDDRIQVLVKTLTRQMTSWTATLPSRIDDNGSLRRSCQICDAFIHEVGLYGVLQGQSPSATRISIIYECLHAAMKAFTDFLELPLTDMADFTVLDWRSVHLVVMLCTKSSIVLDCSYYTAEAAQRVSWLHKAIDTLCFRLKELHRMAGSPQTPGPEHFFPRAAIELNNVKTYHQSCIQRALAQSQSSATTSAAPNAQPLTASGQPMPMFDSMFDMDPFNDVFWAGLTDPDGNLVNMYV